LILYSVERRDAHRVAQQEEYYSKEVAKFLVKKIPQKAITFNSFALKK